MSNACDKTHEFFLSEAYAAQMRLVGYFVPTELAANTLVDNGLAAISIQRGSFT